ncbi:enoyl-CoA hydratase [Algimonas ampicilliniresistens]|jgi:enoyl-CoA hydratase/carnithine racemase|uniref:Enoyl-CoA hydratase n=1 Tax=Algimonas ampicilliniresistens TaxID=1298735 RepID=A0ABQ5V8B6_9PROT|nr:enoyl-CoA hydratase-related protein [Algimonas ampicilliniresistens]GLQ22836.1 enoyl-CoA hydratase [Algimonas ampicilliniresistens]
MTPNLKTDFPQDGMARLTLSQPARRNAINADMWAALPRILAELEATHPKVLIVQGDGEHFASGADISEFGTLYQTPESSAKISADISAAMDALAAFPVPTIALIRGACVGGGLGLALSCDLRFADNTSKFAITPAKLGLVYPFSDVARLIEAVGAPNAKDILFSARLIKAKRAEKMGLVNKVVKTDEIERAVLDYAETIAAQSSQSARTMKHMFAAYAAGQREETADMQALFLGGFASDDFKEGYTAFMEKRRPDFD